MTAEELEKIVELKDEGKINKAITGCGFFDMKRHPSLKKVSLVPILQSKNVIRTDWIYSGKFSYNLAYFYAIEGYDGYEFLLLQINVDKPEYSVQMPRFWGIYYRKV